MEEKMQKITLRVHNLQEVDGEKNEMDMTVVGTASLQSPRLELCYSEYDEEMHETKTRVCVEENRFVSVTREGQYASQMLFECGKRNTTAYKTPYGDLMMGMYTKRIDNRMTWLDGTLQGSLTFSYTTDFAGQGGIENEMTLTIL